MSATLKSVSVLIIDLDGTLVDTKADISLALNSTLAAFSLPPIEEEAIALHVGTGITPLIEERVPVEKRPEFIRGFEESYLSHIADTTRLYPGWETVLDRLGERRAFILTNKIQRFTDALVRKLHLERYFVAAYGREAFSERKPSPGPVLNILDREGRGVDQALMVGDMPADIRSGQAAGTFTCAALYGYGPRESLLALSPTCSIERPEDLLDIIG